MKKSAIVLLNIGFWFCYLVLIFVILAALYGNNPNAEELIGRTFESIALFALLPSSITFYSFYFFLFPRIKERKNYILTGLFAFGICIASGLISFASLYTAFGEDCLSGSGDEMNSPGEFIAMILFISFVAFISGVIALVIRGFITWVEEIKLKEELKQKNHETELALVKSQLDPHFLFNTLNNIDVLILKDQEVASEYLNKLSDIMRFMLFETKAEEIPLTKELEYIEKYIELQKIRTNNKDYVNYSVNGNPKNRRIAPMLFIPFIENAFKHSGNKKLKDAIKINIDISEHEISMTCINKVDANRTPEIESNGLGNQLIEQRINLLYPERHSLEVSNLNNTYSVILRIAE